MVQAIFLDLAWQLGGDVSQLMYTLKSGNIFRVS